MSKNTRQAKLLELLKHAGYETIEVLACRLSVSEQTVRRDIYQLDQIGKLRRTHGGAAFVGGLELEDYIRRRSDLSDVKRKIAQQVADLVPDGASLFIDAGTTCEAIAAALLARKDLKIITYSLGAAFLLKDRADFTVGLPGGFVRHIDGSVVGDSGNRFIERFRFDMSIISVSGIEANGTMGDDDHWEVMNVRAAMDRSSRVLLAVDATKFNRPGLISLGSIREVDILVTDAPPTGALARYIGADVRTYVA